MEKELEEYNFTETQIKNLRNELLKIENDIIKKYCPFKKNDKVIYTEWWRGTTKDYFGIVNNIQFKGISKTAIDNKWIITVQPTTNKIKKLNGNWNRSYVFLGDKNIGDVIRKAETI